MYEELDFTILNSYDFVYNHLQGVVFESYAPIHVSLLVYNCSCCVDASYTEVLCIVSRVYTCDCISGHSSWWSVV